MLPVVVGATGGKSFVSGRRSGGASVEFRENRVSVTDLALVAEAAREAGELALRSFRQGARVWFKSGRSPVSEVDIAVDSLLRKRLTGARPDYGWLSEETADSSDRLERSRVFVVDPIDGTWAFIAGRRDWAVSVAVVEDGYPVAAALFAPARDWMFTAARGAGAWFGDERLRLDGARTCKPLRVAGPRRLVRRLKRLRPDGGSSVYVSSLALRFASVALGRFDVALASDNSHDWDLAAAHLILSEAGCRISDLWGDRVVYNRVTPRHPALVAAPGPLHRPILEALAAGNEERT